MLINHILTNLFIHEGDQKVVKISDDAIELFEKKLASAKSYEDLMGVEGQNYSPPWGHKCL
jgi:DNA-binding ferritin-like protein (Dps family)